MGESMEKPRRRLVKVTGPNGESLHGGACMWPLPDGDTPGAWVEVTGALVMCRNGLHLTDQPAKWWRAEVACRVFIVDAEDFLTGADGQPVYEESDAKSVCRKARLVREANESELCEMGIYKSGSHRVERGSFVALGMSEVVAVGDSRGLARESSRVVARGSSRVVAWGSSTVEARGSSRVVARESSRVVARESSRVEAWESSTVEAWESSTVEARGSSSVEAWGSSRVEARGSSRVVAWGSSSVEAWESSRVVAWGSSRVVARESSRVEAWDIGAHNQSTVKLEGDAACIDRRGDVTKLLSAKDGEKKKAARKSRAKSKAKKKAA